MDCWWDFRPSSKILCEEADSETCLERTWGAPGGCYLVLSREWNFKHLSDCFLFYLPPCLSVCLSLSVIYQSVHCQFTHLSTDSYHQGPFPSWTWACNTKPVRNLLWNKERMQSSSPRCSSLCSPLVGCLLITFSPQVPFTYRSLCRRSSWDQRFSSYTCCETWDGPLVCSPFHQGFSWVEKGIVALVSPLLWPLM
jgi:hypothetical protein